MLVAIAKVVRSGGRGSPGYC